MPRTSTAADQERHDSSRVTSRFTAGCQRHIDEAHAIGGAWAPMGEEPATTSPIDPMVRMIGFGKALGTLNHTSLTLEAAFSRGIPVPAVALNAPTAPDAVFVDHCAELRALWPGVPITGPTSRIKSSIED